MTDFRQAVVALVLVLVLAGCGGGSNSSSGGGNPGGGSQPTVPPIPTGLTATGGSQQVMLTWNASSGATSYHVKRATSTGGPYSQVASPVSGTYTDSGVTNGTTYYYVVSAVNSAGESGNSAEASATPSAPAPAIPATPTGLTATAGNQQVTLNWNASTGATSYRVKRATTSSGPYSQIANPGSNSHVDTAVTNGTTYYYVVSAVNSAGESADSAVASAKPSGPMAGVHVAIDVLANRHPISPYVYGGSYPKNPDAVKDSGLTVVRWGGNATSRYNWKTHTYNAANDWYFEDYVISGFSTSQLDSDSIQFINDVKAAGGNPLMTMVMLTWVAKDTGNRSFSVARYGAQCKADPYNSDAGNGVKPDCQTNVTGNDPNDANVPLLDTLGNSDPVGSVYRDQWAAALAGAFGSAKHFYDMDNEPDIWGGTHRDVHPGPSKYDELRDTYLGEARVLKTWDPQAIRLGPVSCCWWFYWNGADSNDKGTHAGIDLLPWWLNEIYWHDQVDGVQSLDVFDIHAYPDGPDTSTYTTAQKRALTLRIYRDFWDPSYVSEGGAINQQWATKIQPNKTIPFRIPRMRSLLNAIYPGIPLSITEWSAAFAGEADFSTALADADAYGILGRERVYLASRWEAADPANPNYQALKLFTNYDGQHHGFDPISVAATHDADPNLFSTYAAVDATGTTATVLVLNKDPQNAVQAQFKINGGFTPTRYTGFTLAQTAPGTIAASSSQPWASTLSFAPYSATLLVITGSTSQAPGLEWELNPDAIMVPANGSATLHPRIVPGAGTGTVTLGLPSFDNGIALSVTQANISSSQTGSITVAAGNTPGFYRYSVPGTDSHGVAQNQSGWVVVGNPPASLTKSGDNQTGAPGTQISLSVTLYPGSSGGAAGGATLLFSTDAGTLSNRLATTNSVGTATVVLTLPSSAGDVHVTAEGPYALGHPVVTFKEAAQ